MPSPALSPAPIVPAQCSADCSLLSSIKTLLSLSVPAPIILTMIIELLEHGPGIFQKVIR